MNGSPSNTGGSPVQQQRHADERALVFVLVTVGKRRLAADARYNERTSAREDLQRERATRNPRVPRAIVPGADGGRHVKPHFLV